MYIFYTMNTKKTFLKGVNWALAAIITLLGFAGCDKLGRVEYGMPHADYIVKGAVVDKTTQNPIEGISVCYFDETLVPGDPTEDHNPILSVSTNAKGEFLLKTGELSHPVGFQIIDKIRVLPVYAIDIDGPLNGSYESDFMLIDFKKAEQTKKPGRWYEGEFTVTVNIELTPVEVEK